MYDSTHDTKDHIKQVVRYLFQFINRIAVLAAAHDKSKLESPELEGFNEFTPKLRGLTYGSDEYKKCLSDLQSVLKHHYANNPHHPEHHANGVEDMSLTLLTEMLCDWKAATERHADGNLAKSIAINQRRFGISREVTKILYTTAQEFGWITENEVPAVIPDLKKERAIEVLTGYHTKAMFEPKNELAVMAIRNAIEVLDNT